MCHDEGLRAINPIKIDNGPSLLALVASQAAYLGKTSHELLFVRATSREVSTWNRDLKLCVEGIHPLGGERVFLRLRDRYDGRSLYQMSSYNVVKRKGILEDLKQLGEAIHYIPARWVPDTIEMMKLSDNEFIMAYALHMATYKLPIKCEYPGCTHVIRVPMDLRRMAGQNFCPVHYPICIAEREPDNPYFRRVVMLLPDRCVPTEFWSYPDLPVEIEPTAVPNPSMPRTR